MARRVRSQPRPIRAARRAAAPTVRARRAPPGRHHPASAADVRDVLERLGEEFYYGVRLIELVPARAEAGRLPLGRLIGPGHIVLFDQPRPPWRLGSPLSRAEKEHLTEAGAVVAQDGSVGWPGDTLKRFMLRYVLTHELAHHILQHERRLGSERGARTPDHEARAEVIAARMRARLL
jgi:hypothetical protein